jgi:hypothetical protein
MDANSGPRPRAALRAVGVSTGSVRVRDFLDGLRFSVRNCATRCFRAFPAGCGAVGLDAGGTIAFGAVEQATLWSSCKVWLQSLSSAYFTERCVSGRNGTPGERVYPKGTVGSNPTLSVTSTLKEKCPRRTACHASVAQFWFLPTHTLSQALTRV